MSDRRLNALQRAREVIAAVAGGGADIGKHRFDVAVRRDHRGDLVRLFAGIMVGLDKTPWPLLLTILNLPHWQSRSRFSPSCALGLTIAGLAFIVAHQPHRRLLRH